MYRFNESNWISDIQEPDLCTIEFMDNKAVFEKSCFSKAIVRCLKQNVETGKTYKFRVELTHRNIQSVIFPYAIVGFANKDGGFINRIFANNTDESGNCKELVFTVPEETVALRIELGLKGSGRVEWSVPSVTECTSNESVKAKLASVYVNSYNDLDTAFEKIIAAVDVAGKEKPDLMVLSEVIYDLTAGVPISETSENLKTGGRLLNAIREKAKEFHSYIVLNLHEKDDENRYYNTSVLIDRAGEIVGKYRKTHNSMSEFEKGISPGNEYPVFDTDFGKLGMLICWDLYFPEPARILAQNGADIIAVSTVGDSAYRQISRALENGVYVIVSGNHYANKNEHGILPCKIIDTNGIILSQTMSETEPAIAQIDVKDKGRTGYLSIPSTFTDPHNVYMNDRRTDLYGQISEF